MAILLMHRSLTAAAVLIVVLLVCVGSRSVSHAAKNPSGVAVVIGNKVYEGSIFTADFVHRDKEAFRLFIVNAPGYDPENLSPDQEQTQIASGIDELSPEQSLAIDCDTLAASPFDPGYSSTGVEFSKLNSSAAVSACRLAVEANPDNPRLEFQLARALIKGKLYGEAVEWNRKAAEQGYANAENNLGRLYDLGHGVLQDYAEAARWYRKAVEHGSAIAERNLGYLHYYGRGVPQDYAEAVPWFRRAAEHGIAAAANDLGWMYKSGRGVSQNDVEAVRWYRVAVEHGDEFAQTNLAWMFEEGRGVAHDYSEAVRLYRLAAEQGFVLAMINLGRMYKYGRGGYDDKQAYFWFSIAMKRGDDNQKQEAREERRKIGTLSWSNGERKEIQKRAAEWNPN
jgi:TPR repeat protein